jgi:hypothetical protein
MYVCICMCVWSGQIIHIFRRVLPRVAPSTLDSAIAVPQGALPSWLTSFQHSGAPNLHDLIASSAEPRKGRGSVAAYLLLCYASSLSLQIRGRADKRPMSMLATMPGSVLAGALSPEVSLQLRALLQTLFNGEEGADKPEPVCAPCSLVRCMRTSLALHHRRF